MIRLLVNATVLTMDPTLPRAEALAVKNGHLVEVGGTDEILWLREDEYDVIDLEGRTVVPGFVDPHNHFSIGALETFWADCRNAASVAEVQRALAAAAAKTPHGEWVRAVVYDHQRRRERRHPTRLELDEAVGDRPALLMHYSHHQAVVSSGALAAVGITRATPDPRGGEIAHDRSGEPTGLLYERAMSAADCASREGGESRFVASAEAASRVYAEHGITTIQDAAVTPAMAQRYAEARGAGVLAIDVVETMVGSRGWFDPPTDAAPGPWLKLFVDGGYRCAVRFLRDGRTVSHGFLFYEREELAAILLDAWRGGRRVVCHAIGNVGIETAVGAIGDAVGREPVGRDRVRIDHAMFLTPDLVRRIADLGVWVVAQPSFLWDGATTGPPGLMLRPFRTVAEAGIAQAFSSDFPCGALAPLAGIAAAVTRRTRSGDLADPEQAISAQQALEAYTVAAAQAAGLGDDRGSLQPGKRADFLVLSTNPLECNPVDLSGIRVLQTWVYGKLVTNKA
jgi:predicted amidohydrolase YtcJ